MKILHIVSAMELGGIENLIFSLLLADPAKVYILAIMGTRDEALERWPALAPFNDHLIFAEKGKGFQWKVVHCIKATCEKHKITVLHSHHIGPLIYASLISQWKPITHVHTQHDIWHLSNRKHWLIEYAILKFRNDIRLIAISKDIYKYMKDLFPASPLYLVHNGIDTERFQPGDKVLARRQLNLPEDALIIATAGRLEQVKGQIYLLRALAELPFQYKLVIAGNGSLLGELEQAALALGLSDRVFFLQHLTEVETVYQASDMFCLPSLNEGLPLVILEAQACNIPVICSQVGSCAEGVDPASGTLVPPGDATAITKACLQTAKNQGAPRGFILKFFSLNTLIKAYQAIYQQGEPSDHD